MRTDGRLQSLDALRGLDMFLMMGLPAFASALIKIVPALEPWRALSDHCVWEGFHLYDLVFPLFVFLSGVSLAFSVERQRAAGVTTGQFLLKSCRRVVTLVFLGACLGGLLAFDLSQTRFFSVLGLIGVSGAAAGAVAWKTRTVRAPLFWAAGLFLVVAFVQNVLVVGGYGRSFESGRMVNCWFDQLFPGVLFDGNHDPEGALCVVSATVIPLVGCAVGRGLAVSDGRGGRIGGVWALVAAGVALVLAGQALAPVYPIIKKAWTGTFNLVAIGWSLLFFAAFHWLIDIKGWRGWSVPLQDVGRNAIACYLFLNLLDIPYTVSRRLFSGLAAHCGAADELVLCVSLFGIVWAIFAFFRRKGIFFKV